VGLFRGNSGISKSTSNLDQKMNILDRNTSSGKSSPLAHPRKLDIKKTESSLSGISEANNSKPAT